MSGRSQAYGAVLPSYDVETRVYGRDRPAGVRLYSHIAFGLCVFFMILEVLELYDNGPVRYFSN